MRKAPRKPVEGAASPGKMYLAVAPSGPPSHPFAPPLDPTYLQHEEGAEEAGGGGCFPREDVFGGGRGEQCLRCESEAGEEVVR
eukprot:2355158-Pyramimonas_sp.AAC.1